MKTNRYLPFYSVCLLASSITVFAASGPRRAFSKGGESTISFTATGPGGIQIEGKTKEMELRDDGEALTVIIPLKNLSTGIGLRDRHLKEKYLETEKYPNAELRIARADLKIPGEGGREEASIKGVLKLHGQEKPVTVSYRAAESGGFYNVSGNLHLNMSEFGIPAPSYLGVTVRPEVDVSAAFVLKGGLSTQGTVGTGASQ